MESADRLRDFAGDLFVDTSEQFAKLYEISDAIEDEAKDVRRFAERLEAAASERADVTLFGVDYTPLPVDADGVPIRVGDVMEWVDPDGEVTVTCVVDAVGTGCFFAWDNANGRFAQKCASAYRHHRAPTVEDVLREFVDWYVHTHGGCDEDGIIAECAARLRLAGGGE